jgi:hypothetical protein
MAASKPMNAIEKRLDVLVGLWNELAENPEARMSRWLVDQEETRMIDAFLGKPWAWSDGDSSRIVQ